VDALIFVAVAVAWAVYLVPKALSHHEESVRSRSVDRFSHSMRVLARREPVDRRNARLVVQPGRGDTSLVVSSKGPGPSPAEIRARREAARRAARRRRHVLSLLLLALATVVTVAALGYVAWWWTAAPGGLLVGWLVACRLMVRSERRTRAPRVRVPAFVAGAEDEGMVHPDEFAVVRNQQGFDEVDAEAVTSIIATGAVDPALWDPLPVTLPTYVDAPAATRRTVRTIDLDSTGVWSSGHDEADSALAREADAAEREARATTDDDGRRATGS
jgi:hypothetical protein